MIVASLLACLVASCEPSARPDPTAQIDPPSTTATSSPMPTTTSTPAPTPTPSPPKELTVCQAEEPNTLFIYGGPSRAARNVLAGIYDGPIDTRGYKFEPVILEKLPSLADGDVALRTVEVEEGEEVADVNGQVMALHPGVTLLNADAEEVTFEAGDVITTTQMVITFTLRADVTWADGEPLTADDSRFSYQLVGTFDDPALQRRYKQTEGYKVVDERTVVWTGVPGYRDTFYSLNFYHPLPRHKLGVMEVEQLLKAEVAHRRPLGWGAFVVEEWVAGEHVTLVKNPHYFRASEGGDAPMPYLDRVTFRFVEPRQALDDLLAGECDLVTQDVMEAVDLGPLLEAADAGEMQLIASPSSEWEHLDFGIQPVSWAHRAVFFDDVRVRQAVAHCVDRARIASEAFPYAGAVVADSYVAPGHPLHASDRLHRWAYDPPTGRSLLGEAGWLDEDGDGIREAYGVSGIINTTPLSVTLLTTEGDPARERTARILEESLAACGVGLAVDYLPPEAFYADGPDGPVFGRQFDLALFSWLNGLRAPCELYMSSEIPMEENWWAASNNPGYASDDYDAACHGALGALYGMDAYDHFHREAQRIFSHDLPVLPLYFVPKVIAARPEVSGVVLDPSQYVDLWNIEAVDVSRTP